MYRKIYIAGHTGLVGSAVLRLLESERDTEIVTVPHGAMDLRDTERVLDWFSREQPTHVVMCAGRVGGILANSQGQFDFMFDNALMGLNVAKGSMIGGAERVVYLGSSCVYPRDTIQPIREESFLSGVLEATNRGYAAGKIASIEAFRAAREQYGLDAYCLMPCNLYGPGDNYDAEGSHVIPGLIRRIHEAKLNRDPSVTVWGSGKALREFMWVGDLATAIKTVLLSEGIGMPFMMNVGSGEELTIESLAYMICEAEGYGGTLEFDKSKPDGTPRKILDSTLIGELGWEPMVGLEMGLRAAYRDFLKRYGG